MLTCGSPNPVVKREAHPSAQTPTPTTPIDKFSNPTLARVMEAQQDVDDDAASTLHERRRIAKVTVYEVDSAHLFKIRESMRENARPTKDGEDTQNQNETAIDDPSWIWPQTFPRIDGVMMCYDVSQKSSIEGLDDICRKSSFHPLKSG